LPACERHPRKARAEAPAAFRREEAKRLAEIERGRLVDVTRQAMFEAIDRFPSPPPKHLFGWLRETVAHFTLNFLHGELAEVQTTRLRAQEAEAMQASSGGSTMSTLRSWGKAAVSDSGISASAGCTSPLPNT